MCLAVVIICRLKPHSSLQKQVKKAVELVTFCTQTVLHLFTKLLHKGYIRQIPKSFDYASQSSSKMGVDKAPRHTDWARVD